MGRRGIPSSARERRVSLADDPGEVERLARLLAAAGASRILAALVEARRGDPEGGWMFLSQIAAEVGEAPGSAALAVQKLLPFLEEDRRKGKRWFRSRVRRLEISIGEHDGAASL